MRFCQEEASVIESVTEISRRWCECADLVLLIPVWAIGCVLEGIVFIGVLVLVHRDLVSLVLIACRIYGGRRYIKRSVLARRDKCYHQVVR